MHIFGFGMELWNRIVFLLLLSMVLVLFWRLFTWLSFWFMLLLLWRFVFFLFVLCGFIGFIRLCLMKVVCFQVRTSVMVAVLDVAFPGTVVLVTELVFDRDVQIDVSGFLSVCFSMVAYASPLSAMVSCLCICLE